MSVTNTSKQTNCVYGKKKRKKKRDKHNELFMLQ